VVDASRADRVKGDQPVWQPAPVQWRVIVVTFVLASFAQCGAIAGDTRDGRELMSLLFWVFVIGGGLFVWYIEGNRSK
jgi:hypothetical protein